jgi:hypothetical protein
MDNKKLVKREYTVWLLVDKNLSILDDENLRYIGSSIIHTVEIVEVLAHLYSVLQGHNTTIPFSERKVYLVKLDRDLWFMPGNGKFKKLTV